VNEIVNTANARSYWRFLIARGMAIIWVKGKGEVVPVLN
jgi:hypothetical protein